MKKKSTIIAVIVIAALLLGAFIAWKCLSPKAAAGEKTLTVNVHHLQGEDSSFTVKTAAEFLRGALEPEGLISGPEQEYGLWIQTVDGETADESLQQWWGYDINDQMALYGADEQPVADGDVIDFTLHEGY